MIAFYKYHGTGNDFILIDDRDEVFDSNDHDLIEKMCSRRFGIGADGLILLRNKEGYDFEMIYFNSDGHQSSMCGNGGRCIVKFAYDLEIIDSACKFLAIDGAHDAVVNENHEVKLKMNDVRDVLKMHDDHVLDTGSPHYVKILPSVEMVDVKAEGSKIRYSDPFHKEGINVNFVQHNSNSIEVATYERGVEDETYSCGTGVTASALISHLVDAKYSSPIQVGTKGGKLSVHFKHEDGIFTNVWLQGPAKYVFKGSY